MVKEYKGTEVVRTATGWNANGGGGHNVDDDKDEHTERQGKTKHI